MELFLKNFNDSLAAQLEEICYKQMKDGTRYRNHSKTEIVERALHMFFTQEEYGHNLQNLIISTIEKNMGSMNQDMSKEMIQLQILADSLTKATIDLSGGLDSAVNFRISTVMIEILYLVALGRYEEIDLSDSFHQIAYQELRESGKIGQEPDGRIVLKGARLDTTS